MNSITKNRLLIGSWNVITKMESLVISIQSCAGEHEIGCIHTPVKHEYGYRIKSVSTYVFMMSGN